MEYVGIAALGLLALVVGLLVGVFLLFLLVRSLFQKAAHRVVDRAVDKAMDAGVEGVKALGRTVGEEVRKNDPRRLEAEVTRVARGRQGRVAVSDVMAQVDVAQPVAERCLEGLARRGVCQAVQEPGGTVYVFESFRPRQQVAACHYCGGTFQDTDPSGPCPSCGATLVAKSVVVE